MPRTATDAAGRARPPDPLRLHLVALRRVLALAEGRRAVHRRPPRRGRLPDRRGARAPREHVVLDRRALLAGARLRGLPGAPGGRARGVPPPAPPRRPDDGLEPAAPLFSLDQSAVRDRPSPPTTSTSRRPRARSRAREVEGAIEAIAAAERVLIAGTDQMAFFASYLRHLLMLLDIRAEIAASPSQEALSRLGRIDEGTLVIGLSAGRPHPLVVRAMKIARHRKARARWRSPTRRCPRSPSSPSARSTTRRTRRPSCARTPACCRSSRRSPTASTPRRGAVRRPHQGLQLKYESRTTDRAVPRRADRRSPWHRLSMRWHARRSDIPRQGRPGRDAQGRRHHGRRRRRAGEDRRGRRRRRGHGARARARRHPPRRRRRPHVATR